MRLSHYEALKPCSAQLGRETRQLNNETNTRFLATSELVEQTRPRIRISVGDFSALQETSRARARERESEEGIFALVPVVRRARAIKPLWLETAVGRGCGAIVFARLFFDCDVVSGFLSWRRRGKKRKWNVTFAVSTGKKSWESWGRGMRGHEIMELCSRSSMDFLSLFLRDKGELGLD